MNNNFFVTYSMPEILSKEELLDNLRKSSLGDIVARNKIIEHNMRLVLFQVNKYFSDNIYDKEELISVGMLGLINSVDTFDLDKNVEFSTYACKCIDNEILKYLNKKKKYMNDFSLSEPVSDDEKITLGDILCNNLDLSDEYMYDEIMRVLHQIINDLPETEKDVIMLRYGFADGIMHSQKEIASKYGVLPSNLCRFEKRVLRKIEIRLKEENILDIQEKKKKINNGYKYKKIVSIYEYFHKEKKEDVDRAISLLPDEYKELLVKKYGKDLNNPVRSECWDIEYSLKFYGNVIPMLKRLMINPSRRRGRKAKNEYLIMNMDLAKDDLIMDSNVHEVREEEIESKDVTIKKDYDVIMDLIEDANKNELLNIFRIKELIIFWLSYGYVNNKYFTSDAIAEFFDMDCEEVIDIAKKVLYFYKNNTLIDNKSNTCLKHVLTFNKNDLSKN